MTELTEKQLIFHEAFKKWGGLFRTEGNKKLSDTLMLLRDRLDRVRISKPHYPDYYIDFINDQSINAKATFYKGIYLIGINYSTCYILTFLFERMMCSPHILPEIGDITKEVELPKLFNAQITGLFALNAALDLSNIPRPNDETRLALSETMTFEALTSLALHEYGHITNGHCDYLISFAEGFSFPEYATENKEDIEISHLDFQTFEMDADSFSINHSIRLLHERKEKWIFPAILNPILKEMKDHVYFYVYSTYTFWRLFGQQPYDLNNLTNSTHPPAFLRQKISLAVIATMYQGMPYLDKIAEVSVKAVCDVEYAFATISELGMQPDGNFFEDNPIAKKHLDTIMANWNILRPKLEPFSKGKLAESNDF